jgi:hypothetical protein
VLFGLVREHVQEFFRYAREAYAGPLPKYVTEEFRKYLTCGDFAHGGPVSELRGRRMAGTAAHLVDRVLPAAPVRQYVLAFPYELSGLAATRPDVLRALSRLFWEGLRRRYARWAKRAGYAKARVETGAVTGVHRVGASLNVHVHFHVLSLDGVHLEAEDGTGSTQRVPT